MTQKHGLHGQIRIRVLFHPQILVKSRGKTSTFSAARTATQIGGLPATAGRNVFSVFGKRGGDRRSEDVPQLPELPSGQSSHPIGVASSVINQSEPFPASSVEGGSSQQPGSLKITVLDAKDFSTSETKAYVALRVGDKEFKTKQAHKTAVPEW
jgi:hypothetical protein